MPTEQHLTRRSAVHVDQCGPFGSAIGRFEQLPVNLEAVARFEENLFGCDELTSREVGGHTVFRNPPRSPTVELHDNRYRGTLRVAPKRDDKPAVAGDDRRPLGGRTARQRRRRRTRDGHLEQMTAIDIERVASSVGAVDDESTVGRDLRVLDHEITRRQQHRRPTCH